VWYLHNKAVKDFTQWRVQILEKMSKTRCWSFPSNLISKKNWSTGLLTGKDERSRMRMKEPAMYIVRKANIYHQPMRVSHWLIKIQWAPERTSPPHSEKIISYSRMDC